MNSRHELCRAMRPWGMAFLLSLTWGGCAFVEGNPWGRLEVELALRFDPSDARLTKDGEIKTALDYAVQMTELRLEVWEVVLAMSSASAASSSFDPASPPAGYSLCHAQHCHANDGRLVSYEEIAAELLGASAEQGSTVALSYEGTHALSEQAMLIQPKSCESACQLERGQLSSVSVRLGELTIRGRVRDLRAGELRRMDDVREFEVRLELSLDLRAPLQGVVGDDQKLWVSLALDLALAESLFDQVDWATQLGDLGPSLDDAAQRALGSALATSSLTVQLSRH